MDFKKFKKIALQATQQTIDVTSYLAEKTVSKTEVILDKTVQVYKDKGLEDGSKEIGHQLGTNAKSIKNSLENYIEDVKKSNKKATNPLTIGFKKDTMSHSTAKTVVSAINTIRKIGNDAKNQIEELNHSATKRNKPN